MVMDTSTLERITTLFQARARGYLTRYEVRRAREDFEEIVNEIDGNLSQLNWTEKIISTPHFADTAGPRLRPGICSRETSGPGLHVSAAQSSIYLIEERGEQSSLIEREEAERDKSPECLPSSSVRGDGKGQRQDSAGRTDGGMMESTGRSSSIWSSLELDMSSHPHKGSQQRCLAQEVPRTPEALRLHRNTLTMELLWLQQAIDSRKKYLSLKDRLSVS
ncbi:IQ domain-containing protein C [Cololabis saira]|uniref:IQ domain-containing protein C n=1 Tax=Cololabis saira TaxID=129043 RepID=UPI002AD312F6|nr:IQ domain-containing protein C [Cololabis saira]